MNTYESLGLGMNGINHWDTLRSVWDKLRKENEWRHKYNNWI
jgi:hypothetical protein